VTTRERGEKKKKGSLLLSPTRARGEDQRRGKALPKTEVQENHQQDPERKRKEKGSPLEENVE